VTPVPRLPPFAPGMRIGLLGGSFNPPHEGHAHITRLALRRLKLDRVWWLVTPGNPLKSLTGLAALKARMEAARRLDVGHRIVVSDIEAQIDSRFTYDTLRWLRRRAPGVHFVWIMGADNLRSFHSWQKWREIAELVPIAVVDRLGPSLYATGSVGAQALSRRRVPESEARSLPGRPTPAWVLLHGLKSPLSSTTLRSLRRSQKCCRPQAKIESA
jgi:nicotinate-nucleotide adenylyltransferase